jgi:hypothetical protein
MAGQHERLFQRIELLSQAGRPIDAVNLHTLRERRNELAHEPAQMIGQEANPASWEELEGAIALAFDTMKQLGIVTDRPTYEFPARRQ